MLKIPQISYMEITKENFLKEVKKRIAFEEPKFKMFDIVNQKGMCGTTSPAVVIGIRLSVSGWQYTLSKTQNDGRIDLDGYAAEKELELI